MLHRKALLAAAALVLAMAGQILALERVPAKFSYLEVRFSYAMPLGAYDGLPGFDFDFGEDGLIEFDADRVYDDGFGFGLTYGQLFGANWRTSAGFDYANNKIKNPIIQQSGIYEYRIGFTDDLTYQQYDLAVHTSYSPLGLVQSTWSPYFGLGGAIGMASATASGYESDYEFNLAFSLDFGLDAKLWTAPDDRSFLTLASINSWNFAASGDRVKHLQIGGGLRYFFKP